MNTVPVKHQYISPQIERINLDNEISLILVSGSPGDPFKISKNSADEFFNSNPFVDVVV